MKKFLILAVICGCAQLAFAGYDDDIDELIPKLASTTVSERYDAWMKLQEMAANASQPGADTNREALATALAEKATDEGIAQPARMWIIRQLEYIGGEESVNALAELLNSSDAELQECARRALEKNRASRATTSLRAALKGGGSPSWEIGLMNSLGLRHDAKSVDPIAKRLSKPETAEAAARALGYISTPEAIELLWKNLSIKGAADSLVVAANERVKAKDDAAAKAIYEKLYARGNPATARAAALTGLAKLDYAGASEKIAESLGGAEVRLRHAALAAITAAGPAGSGTLESLWPNANTETKTRALAALNNLPEKLALDACGAEDAGLRLAAIEALGRVGGAASVPVLLKLGAGGGKEKSTATAALARLTNPAATQKLEASAADGEIPARVLAISTLAARQHPPLVAQLLSYAQEPNPTIQEAAFAGFLRVGGDDILPAVGKLALANPSPERFAALEAVAGRVKNRTAGAQAVLESYHQAKGQEAAKFLPTLSLLGGQEGLKAVSDLLDSSDAALKDAALRALANWPDFPAATGLLAAARDTQAPATQYAIAIQGIIHLARTCESEPASQRAGLIESALQIARNAGDKKSLLATLPELPDPKSVAVIKSLLTDAEVKNEAALSGASLAEHLRRSNLALAKELAQALVAADVSEDATKRAKKILER